MTARKNYGIARVEKIKASAGGALVNRFKHNTRKFENTEKEFDLEEQKKNVYHGAKTVEQFMSAVRKRWALVDGKRRSDAVGVLEFMVTTTDGAVKGREKEFFEKSIAHINSLYGADNVVAWEEHWDETTPHLHAFVVPLITQEVKKNRLNKKEKEAVERGESWPTKIATNLNCQSIMGSRGSLSMFQDNFHSAVFADFGLERGEVRSIRRGNYRSDLRKKEQRLEEEAGRRNQSLTERAKEQMLQKFEMRKEDGEISRKKADLKLAESVFKSKKEEQQRLSSQKENELKELAGIVTSEKKAADTLKEALQTRQKNLDKEKADLARKSEILDIKEATLKLKDENVASAQKKLEKDKTDLEKQQQDFEIERKNFEAEKKSWTDQKTREENSLNEIRKELQADFAQVSAEREKFERFDNFVSNQKVKSWIRDTFEKMFDSGKRKLSDFCETTEKMLSDVSKSAQGLKNKLDKFLGRSPQDLRRLADDMERRGLRTTDDWLEREISKNRINKTKQSWENTR